MKSLRFCAAAATTLSLLGISVGTAEAAGFASQQFGGEQGNVVATNPTALYYNPGALGFSPGTALGVYGSLAVRHATWTHQQAPSDIPDPANAQGADTGEARLLNVFGGASAAGTTHLGNLVIGAGFFAGYLVYDMTHYYLHHFRPRGWIGRMLRERHMRHHFQDDTRGFGISAPYWDEVFRTSSRAKRSPQ